MIETVLVIALAGVLLAAFVPTFLAHLRTSKIAEATELLSSLHERARTYYEREHGGLRACLPESAGPFPEEASVDPIEVDFQSDEKAAATWRSLGLTAPRSLRYSYEIEVSAPGCRERPTGVPAITFRARGDLDGDGEPSLLERSAAPSPDGRTLVPHGILRIVSRTE